MTGIIGLIGYCIITAGGAAIPFVVAFGTTGVIGGLATSFTGVLLFALQLGLDKEAADAMHAQWVRINEFLADCEQRYAKILDACLEESDLRILIDSLNHDFYWGRQALPA